MPATWNGALVLCLHFSKVKTNYFVGVYPQSDAESLFLLLLALLRHLSPFSAVWLLKEAGRVLGGKGGSNEKQFSALLLTLPAPLYFLTHYISGTKNLVKLHSFLKN